MEPKIPSVGSTKEVGLNDMEHSRGVKRALPLPETTVMREPPNPARFHALEYHDCNSVRVWKVEDTSKKYPGYLCMMESKDHCLSHSAFNLHRRADLHIRLRNMAGKINESIFLKIYLDGTAFSKSIYSDYEEYKNSKTTAAHECYHPKFILCEWIGGKALDEMLRNHDISIAEAQTVARSVHKIFRHLSSIPQVKFGILHAGNFCLVAHPTEEPRVVLMKAEIDVDSLPSSSALYKIINHTGASARQKQEFLERPISILHGVSLGTLLMEILFPTSIDSWESMLKHVPHGAICWDYLQIFRENDTKLNYIPRLLIDTQCSVTDPTVVELWQRWKTRIRPNSDAEYGFRNSRGDIASFVIFSVVFRVYAHSIQVQGKILPSLPQIIKYQYRNPREHIDYILDSVNNNSISAMQALRAIDHIAHDKEYYEALTEPYGSDGRCVLEELMYSVEFEEIVAGSNQPLSQLIALSKTTSIRGFKLLLDKNLNYQATTPKLNNVGISKCTNAKIYELLFSSRREGASRAFGFI